MTRLPPGRILLVGPALEGGGAETRFNLVATHLFGGEVDVAILRAAKPALPGDSRYLDLRYSGKLSYLRAGFYLRRRLQQYRYSHMMAFGLFPGLVTSLALLGLQQRPIYIFNEITRPLAEVKQLPWGKTSMYLAARRMIYRSADLLTANSMDGLRESSTILKTAHPAQGIRLPNLIDEHGINQALRVEAPCTIPFSRYIISIGRIDAMKRLDSLVEAIDLLKNTSETGLVIVGDGPHRESIANLVKQKHLDHRILMTGEVKNPIPFLKDALAFVLASEFEGFSNAVLEAMFCDVPVVTSYCSSDAIHMCREGAARGFEVGDAEGLSKHLRTLENDDVVRNRLIQKAREYRRPHELHKAIPVYESLFTGEKHCISVT